MKRWKRILLALGGLIVVAVVAIPIFVNANTFRPTIERQLTAALGRSVKVGDLRLSVLSGSLVAKDLSVADDPGFSAAPFLAAKELHIGVRMRQLIFSHELALRGFQIESPQINLIRAANGSWNFSSLGRGGALSSSSTGAASNAPAGNAKSSAPGLQDVFVKSIVIEDGRVAIASLPAQGDAIVYDHVNIVVRDFSFASQIPFEMSADLPAGGTLNAAGHVGPINHADAAASPGDAQVTVKRLDPVAAGLLDPNAALRFIADMDLHAASDGQTLITSGTIHVENLKLRKDAAAAPKPLDFTYSATRLLRENSGQIQDATAKVGDAAIHMSGVYQPVTPGAEELLLNLNLAGQNLPIDELQSLMTAADLHLPNRAVLKSGTLSLSLAIEGPTKALVITGPMELHNTRMVGFDIGNKIHGIAALSGVKTGDTTEIEKLRVTVRITNSGVAAEKIDAVLPAMGELTGSGTVAHDNQLDFNLIAHVASATGIAKVGVGLLSALNGSGSKSGVPLRVTGTPDEPYITADVGGIFQKKTKSIFGSKN